MTRVFILLLLITLLIPEERLAATAPEVVLACPVSIDPARSTYRCGASVQLRLRMPYNGVAPGATVSLAGPGSTTIGGDDPAVIADGIIELIGLAPATTYVLSITGPGCLGPDAITYNFTTPNYTCGNDLSVLINEVLPEPGADVNEDGVNVFLEEQFVEIFNPDPLVEIDLDGWSLIIGGMLRYTFPPATILGPGQTVVVFGGGTLTNPCHYAPPGPLFISSNGDIISLITPTSSIVHTMSFSGTSFSPNVSLALNPDGNVAGGFVPHTTIVTNPVNYSPCFSNHQPGVVLPVALTSFTATQAKGAVTLTWQTAREVDHDYFLIERSHEGRTWEVLKTVSQPSEEGSAGEYFYSTEDTAPPAGSAFYRLHQVDLDGTLTVYGPLQVTIPEGPRQVTLYPNPAGANLWVNSSGTTANFEVFDAFGKRWLQGRLSSRQRAPIPVANLPAGIYFFRLLDGGGAAPAQRWVKR